MIIDSFNVQSSSVGLSNDVLHKIALKLRGRDVYVYE